MLQWILGYVCHLDLVLLASRPVKEYIPVVSSPQVLVTAATISKYRAESFSFNETILKARGRDWNIISVHVKMESRHEWD